MSSEAVRFLNFYSAFQKFWFSFFTLFHPITHLRLPHVFSFVTPALSDNQNLWFWFLFPSFHRGTCLGKAYFWVSLSLSFFFFGPDSANAPLGGGGGLWKQLQKITLPPHSSPFFFWSLASLDLIPSVAL